MNRLAGLLLLVAVGCDKPSSSGAAPPASVTATTTASAAPSAASASSAAPKSPTAGQAWRGTYKSAASTLVPPDGKKAPWSDTPTTAGIGEGALALAVDGATGHVSGTVEGPLGPGTLDGMVTDGKLAATLRRKDPTDQGFTGTVLGAIAGEHLEGTMNVTLGVATTLRTATFTLSPAGAAP